MLRASLSVDIPDESATSFEAYSHFVNTDERQLERVRETVIARASENLKPVTINEKKIRNEELRHLVKAFMLYSTRWNVQDPHTTVYLLQDFEHTPFQFGHSHFGHHRANGLGNDTDEPSKAVLALTGREIDLIIEPTLLRSGDERGEMYDKERVLQPGVVWMFPLEETPSKALTADPLPVTETPPIVKHNEQLSTADSKEISSPITKLTEQRFQQPDNRTINDNHQDFMALIPNPRSLASSTAIKRGANDEIGLPGKRLRTNAAGDKLGLDLAAEALKIKKEND